MAKLVKIFGYMAYKIYMYIATCTCMYMYLATGIGHAVFIALDAVHESRKDVLGSRETAVGEEKDLGEVFSEDLRTR